MGSPLRRRLAHNALQAVKGARQRRRKHTAWVPGIHSLRRLGIGRFVLAIRQSSQFFLELLTISYEKTLRRVMKI
jgi:hypothetical protein